MNRYWRGIAAASICLALAAAAPARADDADDTQAVISSQLEAFRAGNGDAAYSHAAPVIQRLFPTPDVFMTMVARGYPSLQDARGVSFGPLRPEGAGFRQEMFHSDGSGANWIASYTLERGADGVMRITGVQVRRAEDLNV